MNFKLNIQLFGNAVIPYNEGRNGKRSIDGLWEQEFNVAKALTAAIGCEFGSVLNIQDVGQKEQGKVYLDKNNGKLYKCLNTTTSVSNTTENFALFNVQQNSDRLDNLHKIYRRYDNYSISNDTGYQINGNNVFANHVSVLEGYRYIELFISYEYGSSTDKTPKLHVNYFKIPVYELVEKKEIFFIEVYDSSHTKKSTFRYRMLSDTDFGFEIVSGLAYVQGMNFMR